MDEMHSEEHSRPTVVLVAFQDQDNLGVGYLGSTLLEQGLDPFILDFRLGADALLDHIRRRRPLLVGFSIIFQYHISAFRELIHRLRQEGVTCHFTAGGHYPSLRWEELMVGIPGLDSIVRFEGEKTLGRLAEALRRNRAWHDIPGLVWRGKQGLNANPLEPLEEELDNFPLPLRPALRDYVLDQKMATLLASRGCLYDCSFCSIRRFYSQPGGSFKRFRRPELVVNEMRLLRDEVNCTIFLFQDDDFPVGKHNDRAWLQSFCRELRSAALVDNCLWKISCRPDEVEYETFARLRDHGLYLVYLGIESGFDAGLNRMNKHLTTAKTLRGVAALKKAGVAFDFGFMLFDPWTTPAEVRLDLDFMEEVCAEGASSVTFCKMLPYAETEIERRLRNDGRLKGEAGQEDYDFLDPTVARIHDALSSIFFDWFSTRDGLLNRTRWMRYMLAVAERLRLAKNATHLVDNRREAMEIIAWSNSFFIHTARAIVQSACETPGEPDWEPLRQSVAIRHAAANVALAKVAEEIESGSRENSRALLKA